QKKRGVTRYPRANVPGDRHPNGRRAGGAGAALRSWRWRGVVVKLLAYRCAGIFRRASILPQPLEEKDHGRFHFRRWSRRARARFRASRDRWPALPPRCGRGPQRPAGHVHLNHCPYVKAALDKIVRDAGELKNHGIGSVAICSNDPTDYPEDSFDNMKTLAQRTRFPFPYLWDETQAVAKAYGAVCTPDFFGYDGK